jgi:hypothetical protein
MKSRSKFFDAFVFFLISIFFIAIFIIETKQLIIWADPPQGWIIGDWLWNYNDGFVRRGLSGELYLKFQEFSGIGAVTSILATQIILLAFVLAGTLFMATRSKLGLYSPLLLTVPSGLLLPVLDPSAAGRKEYLIYTLFLLWIFALMSSDYVSIKLYVISFFMFITLLMHESLSFFIPYFMLIAFIMYRHERISKNLWYQSLALNLFSGTIGLLLLTMNNAVNSNKLCQKITDAGISPISCDGSISWPQRSLTDAIDFTFEHAIANSFFKGYSIAAVGVLISFALVISKLENGKFLAIMLPVNVLFSIPLFLVAIDWGRWISIHSVLATYIIFLYSSINGMRAQKNGFANLMPLAIIAFNLSWGIHTYTGSLVPGFIQVLLGLLW